MFVSCFRTSACVMNWNKKRMHKNCITFNCVRFHLFQTPQQQQMNFFQYIWIIFANLSASLLVLLLLNITVRTPKPSTHIIFISCSINACVNVHCNKNWHTQKGTQKKPHIQRQCSFCLWELAFAKWKFNWWFSGIFPQVIAKTYTLSHGYGVYLPIDMQFMAKLFDWNTK